MLFYEDGKKVRYNPTNMKKDILLGSGTEVDAYLVDGEVVKFYKNYCNKVRLTKEECENLCNIKTDRVLLPNVVLLDKKRRIRGYKMPFVEDLTKDSLYRLGEEDLSVELKILYNDILTLSENKILIEDLNDDNTVYNDGIYIIDPGSYIKDESLDYNQVYGKNIDIVNEYLMEEIIRDCCISLSRNYHRINAVMKMIKNEMKTNNEDPITFLINQRKYDGILDLVIKKLGDTKYNVKINDKKVFLKADCKEIYYGEDKEIYQYKDKKQEKLLRIYKDNSLKLTKEEINKLRQIKTSRILLPIDDVELSKKNYIGVTLFAKNNDRNGFSNARGSKICDEFEKLLKDVELLSSNGIFIGNISKDDVIYDDGMYIKNTEIMEFCDTKEEAAKKNINALNNFVYEYIDNELETLCSYSKSKEVLKSLKEETLYYAGGTIYRNLYGADNFREGIKKIVKSKEK